MCQSDSDFPATPQIGPIEQKYFQPVIDGMEMVVKAGTATICSLPHIKICGKPVKYDNYNKTGA